MSLLSNTGIRAGASAGGAAEPADIGKKSLRFNSDSTTHLTRTPSSAGNRKIWTWSAWVKRAGLAEGVSNQEEVMFASNGSSDATNAQIQFGEDDELALLMGYPSHDLKTTAEFRDPSQWYHFVVAVDVTQGTASNKVKMYVNGTQLTEFDTDQRSDYADQDWAINAAQEHKIGNKGDNGRPCNMYMSNICFLDGQQLDPTSFGETDSTTGQWVAIQYEGTYGTNGFYLAFDDNSAATAAAIGKDTSGNGHNWTPTNISVSAGVGNDSVLDSPVDGSSSDDTGAGAELSANYPTWNPLHYRDTSESAEAIGWYEDNLVCNMRNTVCATTMSIPAGGGKFYFEYQMLVDYWNAGICPVGSDFEALTYAYAVANLTGGVEYNKLGRLTIAGSQTNSWGDTWDTSHTIGVALDFSTAGNGKVWFSKDGTWQASGNPATGANPAASSLSGDYIVACNDGGGGSPTKGRINFGQQAFEDNAPSGFKCLCSANLPTPAIVKPTTVHNSVTYTGNGGTKNVTGFSFAPDLVWVKRRDAANGHNIFDQARGATNYISTSSLNGEGSGASELTSFDTDGFTYGSAAGGNHNGGSYVSWGWDAGTSAATTNTTGSTNATASWVNSTAGFSIQLWEGTGSGTDIGHSLPTKPDFIITMNRDSSTNKAVYHSSLGAGKSILINGDGTAFTPSPTTAAWNNTEPTSSVFSVGSYNSNNGNGHSMVAYCWTAISGYSSFGSYEGDGAVRGTFVNCGFRPGWILIKNADSTDNWHIYDYARNPYNVTNNYLFTNNNNGGYTNEGSNDNRKLDIVSNGFYPREDDYINSAHTFIYAAFAEAPFKYSRAR